MYGYPKHINTRADVEYLVGFLGTDWATDENKARGLDFLKSLRDNRFHYEFDRVLEVDESPDGGSPAFIVLSDEEGVRRQMRREENPAATIYRFGFSLDEVEQLLATVENS